MSDKNKIELICPYNEKTTYLEDCYDCFFYKECFKYEHIVYKTKCYNEILKQDLKNIKKNIKYWDIKFDKSEKEWKIDDDYIEDFFWYGDYINTYLHPKDIKEEVVKLFEKEFRN